MIDYVKFLSTTLKEGHSYKLMSFKEADSLVESGDYRLITFRVGYDASGYYFTSYNGQSGWWVSDSSTKGWVLKQFGFDSIKELYDYLLLIGCETKSFFEGEALWFDVVGGKF